MIAEQKERYSNPTTALPKHGAIWDSSRCHVPQAFVLPHYIWAFNLNGLATGHNSAILWPTYLPYGEIMWWLTLAQIKQRLGLQATTVEIWLGLGKRVLHEALCCWSCLHTSLQYSTIIHKWGQTRIQLTLPSQWKSQETLESLM